MMDTANNVIDSRLSSALGQYFNGVALQRTVGDCAILSGVRKQNGAPVDIYTPSFAAAQDDEVVTAIGKAFADYDKLASTRLQASERLLTTRAFKKTPALAVLSCPAPVFDDAFDTRPVSVKLQVFDEVLEGLAELHGIGQVHGNLSPGSIRRESPDSVLRLCDLTFSGDRATTVTAQPPAYQSRHVINNAQPRAVDDVHAAGMLGYRILLGEAGPSQVLGGAEEDASTIAAILGDPTDAPTAEQLFLEGHPSAEQIARLLARMTGRLPNAAPYSNADAARRAFRTVLDTPHVTTTAAEPSAAVPGPQPVPTQMVAAPATVQGVSKTTALMLFAGFLVSTGAATYLFLQADKLQGALAKAQADTATYAEALEVEKALSETVSAAQTALREADRLVTQATYSGSGVASTSAADALATAIGSLELADDAHARGAYPEVLDQATAAQAAARAANDQMIAAQASAGEARAAVEGHWSVAETAAGPESQPMKEAGDLFTKGQAQFSTGHYADAAQTWQATYDHMATLVTHLQSEAMAAQQDAQASKANAQGAALILGNTYLARADAAMAATAFADAALLYDAARDAFDTTRIGTSQEAEPSADARTVHIGDTPEEIEQAIALCLNDAPIAASSCPDSRPPGEAARTATLAPYRLDPTEVSVTQFAGFVADTGYRTKAETDGRVVALTSSGEARLIDGAYTWAQPGGAGTSYQTHPDRPVTNIALDDALAYCNWAGARLPSEAEWETAGGDAAFPWGAWQAAQAVWRGAPEHRLPQPVTEAGGTSAKGHQGLSGNAREWVLGEDGPVLKGGSWNTANPADLRLSARLTVPGNAPGVDFGFRCARDAEGWE